MEANYLGWSQNLAPAIMGAPNRPELRAELTDSFCRNDPDIARHFAGVTFLSDHRADVPKSTVPALILQCSDDLIALTDGDLAFAPAWASGRVKLEAGLRDMLRLRSLL